MLFINYIISINPSKSQSIKQSKMNSIIANYFYKGTPIDFYFETKEELQGFQSLLTDQIKTGLIAGQSIPEQIKYMTLQLNELEQLIFTATASSGGKFSTAHLKKIWGKDWKQNKSLWAMNVMSLIKLKALENNDFHGEQIMIIPKHFADTLITTNYQCAICDTKCTSKCKRCKAVWYCCSEHQTQHWKQHKHLCYEAPI